MPLLYVVCMSTVRQNRQREMHKKAETDDDGKAILRKTHNHTAGTKSKKSVQTDAVEKVGHVYMKDFGQCEQFLNSDVIQAALYMRVGSA